MRRARARQRQTDRGEREREADRQTEGGERERQTDRQTDRERERGEDEWRRNHSLRSVSGCGH